MVKFKIIKIVFLDFFTCLCFTNLCNNFGQEGKGSIMQLLGTIILNIITPVFILIAVGALLHRKFKFDLNTLSKLSTYLLLPVIGFVNIYESRISPTTLMSIFFFWACQSASLI